MDLLNQNQYQQPKEIKGKKLIMFLMILSVILIITIIVVMAYISSTTEVKDKLYINGVQQEIIGGLIVEDTGGNKYISIKDLASLLGYEYYNSEYNNDGADTTKCYIKNKDLIAGFELGSNKLYKYEEGTNLDYQYYTMNYSIITNQENKLYIALEDLQQALNAYCIENSDKEIKIYSMENLATIYQADLKEKGYTISAEQNNQKALVYGWIIVNKDGLYSVLNSDYQEIIGLKYKSIYFDEYNKNYIVSNVNGQYGILSKTGAIGQTLKYDELEILNYENMLYKVKYNNKYGIIKKDGTMLTGIIYDDIGYPADSSKRIEYTLIIPEVDGKSGPLIVVKQNNYYGLITLEKGETFLPCDHLEKLYSSKRIRWNKLYN